MLQSFFSQGKGRVIVAVDVRKIRDKQQAWQVT